jgi:hypothetical protein
VSECRGRVGGRAVSAEVMSVFVSAEVMLAFVSVGAPNSRYFSKLEYIILV